MTAGNAEENHKGDSAASLATTDKESLCFAVAFIFSKLKYVEGWKRSSKNLVMQLFTL
jgi:hypothetical protein